MKISVVTISYNQAEFLRQCIDSVLSQNYDNIQYIVVDPGSTDGSRDIIKSYGNRLTSIFEKDAGPADGLNIGFKEATGDIFCYLNSDDIFLPGALARIIRYFTLARAVDVVCGHAHIIDMNSKYQRRVYTDTFDLKAAAYGACITVQPSTFFRSEIFFKVGGFNVNNKSNWDGELLIDMALAGARLANMDAFLSCYRVHQQSITGTGRLAQMHALHSINMFMKINKRKPKKLDKLFGIYYRLRKHLMNPRATFERVRHGPIFGTQR